MASWVLEQLPWMSVRRARRPLEVLTRTIRHSKNHINASLQFYGESPAAEALKRHPYPSSGIDHSVFEEPSDEYKAVEDSTSIRDTPNAPRNSVQTLLHLVKQQDYKSAELVLADLLRMRVEIPLDVRYEKAAIAALMLPHGQSRETSFTNWFSLIPPAHDSAPRSFRTMCQNLLSSTSQPDPSLVMRFGLICASKGYGRKIFRKVIPFVVRFSEPSVSASWMKEFESLTIDYLHNFHPSRVGKTLKSFRDLVIRSHCSAGRTEEAHRVFEATKKDRIPIPRSTMAFLTQSLHTMAATPSTVAVVDSVGHSRETLSIPMSPPDHLQESANLPSDGSSQDPHIVSQLQLLKRSIVSNCPPSPRALALFMQQCQSAGRRHALIMLRRIAFQHSRRSTSLWVTAEMMYYMDQERYDAVIDTFSRCCHLIGVPHDTIVKTLAYYNSPARSRTVNLSSRSLPGPYPMTEKLHPTSQHTTILWKALIHLSKHSRELHDLYLQFLRFARLGRQETPPTESTQTTHESASLPALPPPAQVIDNVHFNPFVFSFRQRFGPYHALNVLQDMKRLGLKPNYYQSATLAEGFAYVGDVQWTMTFVDEAERCYRLRDAEKPEEYPNILGMYTNVLRSLVTARRLDAALEVESRLVKNTGYTTGTNAYTDLTRSFLQYRRQKMSLPSVTPGTRFSSIHQHHLTFKWL